MQLTQWSGSVPPSHSQKKEDRPAWARPIHAAAPSIGLGLLPYILLGLIPAAPASEMGLAAAGQFSVGEYQDLLNGPENWGYCEPRSGPTATYSALAALGAYVIFEDDFEADYGWTVGDIGDHATKGIWNRADPERTVERTEEVQPEDDHTPAPGMMCWVTDSRAGSVPGLYDVDGGKTTLKSPTLDLTGAAGARISYWRWYSNDEGANPNNDTFVVDISNDDGESWTNVETVGPAGPEASGGWFCHEFRVADLVPPTAQIKLRFVAQDQPSLFRASLVEAAIDDFLVLSDGCGGACTGPADGDLNGDLAVDGRDVQSFLNALLQRASADEVCHGDFTGDCLLDANDIAGFVSAVLNP